MCKVICFNDGDTQKNCFSGQIYFHLLDYAFSQTAFFMLVYVDYYGKGYTKIMTEYETALRSFQVKVRSNPSWPGVLSTHCPNTTYKVVFYHCCDAAKEILKKESNLYTWSRPSHPQDLAFFRGNQCWMYSVGHERMAGIIRPTTEDISFLEREGLLQHGTMFSTENSYFSAYDEDLVPLSGKT